MASVREAPAPVPNRVFALTVLAVLPLKIRPPRAIRRRVVPSAGAMFAVVRIAWMSMLPVPAVSAELMSATFVVAVLASVATVVTLCSLTPLTAS